MRERENGMNRGKKVGCRIENEVKGGRRRETLGRGQTRENDYILNRVTYIYI